MSILIKGMKMPQKEGDYDARLHVNRDGTALFYLYKEYGAYSAKKLPSHGILIDADALVADTAFFDGDNWHFGYSNRTIKNAPTIIEREEAEE